MNNAARQLSLDEWSQSFSDPKPQQEVFLQGAEETSGSTYTASRVTPFRSVFATTREAPPVDLVIAYSHARQMRWQQQLTLILLLSGVVGLALVYLISYIISRRITRPIAFLRQGVDHIASGNLDHRVVIQSHSEIGQLAGRIQSDGAGPEAKFRGAHGSGACSNMERCRTTGGTRNQKSAFSRFDCLLKICNRRNLTLKFLSKYLVNVRTLSLRKLIV